MTVVIRGMNEGCGAWPRPSADDKLAMAKLSQGYIKVKAMQSGQWLAAAVNGNEAALRRGVLTGYVLSSGSRHVNKARLIRAFCDLLCSRRPCPGLLQTQMAGHFRGKSSTHLSSYCTWMHMWASGIPAKSFSCRGTSLNTCLPRVEGRISYLLCTSLAWPTSLKHGPLKAFL